MRALSYPLRCRRPRSPIPPNDAWVPSPPLLMCRRGGPPAVAALVRKTRRGGLSAFSRRGPQTGHAHQGVQTPIHTEQPQWHSHIPPITRGIAPRRVSNRDQGGGQTTEMIAFVVVTVAMLIASQIVDGFDAEHAWLYASLLTIGYMISRGLAKSGRRDFYDDNYERNAR